jgi:hypothetical protein
MEIERESEAVKARAEIGGGSGDADFDEGRI